VVEVVAERVQFMGRGKPAAPVAVPAAESFAEETRPAEDDVPF